MFSFAAAGHLLEHTANTRLGKPHCSILVGLHFLFAHSADSYPPSYPNLFLNSKDRRRFDGVLDSQEI